MAFGELGIAKNIALNAPKYKRVVEPFGDNGTFALEPGKRKPKEHIVNYEDETLFAVMSFIQRLTGADKKKLKSYDWISSAETFEKVLAITAVDGPELYYRFFYLKHFGARSKDPETPPAFDWLTNGDDASKILFALPQLKGGLKTVTLLNEEPLSMMSKYGGSDTFFILLPKTPEQVEAVESRLSGLSGNFFFAKKIKENDVLIDAVSQYKDLKVSVITPATIMMATMEVLTNYKNKLNDMQLKIEEAGVFKS